MVGRIKRRAEAERKAYSEAHTALVQNAIIGASGTKKTPREVLENIRTTRVIGKPEWQNQGNFTDVYKRVLQIDGQNRTFYMKENLPMIHKDLDGFLKRRTSQLKVSQENKKNTAIQKLPLSSSEDKGSL